MHEAARRCDGGACTERPLARAHGLEAVRTRVHEAARRCDGGACTERPLARSRAHGLEAVRAHVPLFRNDGQPFDLN